MLKRHLLYLIQMYEVNGCRDLFLAFTIKAYQAPVQSKSNEHVNTCECFNLVYLLEITHCYFLNKMNCTYFCLHKFSQYFTHFITYISKKWYMTTTFVKVKSLTTVTHSFFLGVSLCWKDIHLIFSSMLSKMLKR